MMDDRNETRAGTPEVIRTVDPAPSSQAGGSVNLVAASFGALNRLRRISWGAVLAGALVAISMQLLLSLLGLAIGLWSINVATEENPVAGLGMGTGIWWIVTGAISLFVGGWFAGRLASIPNREDGALNGAVTWAVVFLVGFWFVTTTFGQIVYGVAAPIGRGMAYLGDTATRMATVGAAEREALQWQRQDQQDWMGSSVRDMRQEAYGWMRATGEPELQPEQLEQDAQELAAVAQETARRVALRPGEADAAVNQAIDRFFDELRQKREAVDRDALVNALSERTELSEQEARDTVARWERQYQRLETQAEQAQEELRQQWHEFRQQAAQTTDNVLDAMGNAAMWTFVVMVIGMIAACGGGAIGAPKHEEEAPADEPVETRV